MRVGHKYPSVNLIKEEALPKNSEDFQADDWVKLARNIFVLQNKIRAKPDSFVSYLEKSLDRFQGNIFITADGKSAIETVEGPTAFVEAIEFLKVQKPVQQLSWSDELTLAAKDHVKDLAQTGQMSSIGTGK